MIAHQDVLSQSSRSVMAAASGSFARCFRVRRREASRRTDDLRAPASLSRKPSSAKGVYTPPHLHTPHWINTRNLDRYNFYWNHSQRFYNTFWLLFLCFLQFTLLDCYISDDTIRLVFKSDFFSCIRSLLQNVNRFIEMCLEIDP